jgi:serine/threonine protein kinase
LQRFPRPAQLGGVTNPVPRLNAALQGRYRIERELGEGGTATVYLADDLKHERKVALKVLKPELAAVVGADRFLAEIKTTANLQHPHILPLYDSGEADGFLFYVMPHVEGVSLQDRLTRERQLPVDDAVRIASDLAEALDYAHRHGIVHRDIKPGNVLLHDGQPMIADFGIALAAGAGGRDRLTSTGVSLGTPHYMSPEQATGDQQVGPTADIYALGCVLYEMLVGGPPYTGSTAQAILGRIISGDFRPANELRKAVPSNVDAAIRRALEPVPADRFADAAAFKAALADPSFTTGRPATTGPRSRGGRPWTYAMWPSLAVGAAALTLWSWLRPLPTVPITRTQITLPGDARIAVSGATSYPLDISPDGSHVTYVGESRGGRSLFVRALDDPEIRELPGTQDARHPFFSPDGEWIGFFADGELKKASLAGGAPISIAPQPPGSSGGASWGESGSILFAVGSGLFRVAAEGGEVERISPAMAGVGGVPLGDPRWPQHLPDGEHALLTIAGGTGVLEIATGRIDRLLEGTQARYVPPGYLLFNAGQERLRAVRFDEGRLEVIGAAVPAFDGVFRGPGSGAAAFAVSRTGTMAYMPGSFERSLWIVEPDGREASLGVDARGYRFPRISPDGRQIAVLVDPRPSQVWLIDIARPIPQLLTGDQRDEHHVDPAWTSDGRLTAVVNSDLHQLPLDGGAPELVFARPDEQYQASWSVHGVVMVREEHPETGEDLVAIDPTAGTANVFIGGAADERTPSFSPDGNWLAYASDSSGRFEIYALPYPGPGERVAITGDGGIEPRWSRDGREIVYRRGTRFFAAPVTDADPLGVGTPRALFDANDYDFSQTNNWDLGPDGRFVMVKSDPLTLKKLEIVQNLPAFLEERLPD